MVPGQAVLKGESRRGTSSDIPFFHQSVRIDAVQALAKQVANNFNNALAAIGGHLEAALADPNATSEELRDDIESALAETRRAGRVVRHLMSVTHPAPSKRQAIDPAELVEGSLDTFASESGPSVTIMKNYDYQEWEAHADPQQVGDIISSLLRNSRDASPDGGTITIAVLAVPAEDATHQVPVSAPVRDFVRIDVADHGAGISEDDLPYIFEPFFTTKGSDATGLGLAGAYAVMQQHQGGITVESTPGVGATFRIYLPRFLTSAPSTPAPYRPSPSRAATILVIDDELAVRRVVRKTLEYHGYKIVEAADGASGIERFQSTAQVTLVILDILMPGISGWEVLDWFRAHHPNVPVVLQSGYAVNDEHTTEIAQHAKAFLRKPYELSELVTTVQDALPQLPHPE